jgi:hypothetical protein
MNIQTKISKPKKLLKPPDDIKKTIELITSKIVYIQEIIRETMSSIKKNKKDRIFSDNEATLSISVLGDLFTKTKILTEKIILCEKPADVDHNLAECQQVIDKLSTIICGFGTKTIDDLLFISFGKLSLKIVFQISLALK